MAELKLKVGIARFPYGGNGGIANEHPSIGNWLGKTLPLMKADSRISAIRHAEFTDTPITMTRNAAIQWARSEGIDVLLMLDSDQVPDCELAEDPAAKPFWESSFDFLHSQWHLGPVVIGAPYCGPPPHENCYVFRWECFENDAPDQATKLAFYGREESAVMRGIQPCAALPTGMILFDMRCFDILPAPYFYYEYSDQYESQKASTEDVTCTRDISMIGQATLGYNPVHCNWDAWAGHCKPKVVRKPKVLTVENINEKHREPLLRGRQAGVAMYDWNDRMSQVAQEDIVFLPAASAVQPDLSPEIREKHWFPLAEVENLVLSRCPSGQILDVGGNATHRFSGATKTCGWEADVECDFVLSDLPFIANEFAFAYCRHTVEDLTDPERLLREMSRVATAGYIETPSPMAELTRGVTNGPGATWRGYAHHNWIVWAEDGVLNLVRKYPIAETWSIPQFHALLNQNKFAWNTYYFWDGELNFRIWRHEQDFDINADPDGYANLLSRACKAATKDAETMQGLAVAKPINRLAPLSYSEFEEDVPEVIANGCANH